VDVTAPPFDFPERFVQATRLIEKRIRVFPTSSAGRLFDTVAALMGFTRAITFEGQAAMWLQHLAGDAAGSYAYEMPVAGGRIDWRPALEQIVLARRRGDDPRAIARAFHRGLARALAGATRDLFRTHGVSTVALSGGVVQNDLLVEAFLGELGSGSCEVWINSRVPANDGGLSLGQAALAACERETGVVPSFRSGSTGRL
jgi:hydrogenase maturation protein HypF